MFSASFWQIQFTFFLSVDYVYMGIHVAEKPRDAFRGRSRSPNVVPFVYEVWFQISVP